MRLSTDNPYNEVRDIIMASPGFYWTDYLVHLRICGEKENELVSFDYDTAEWLNDWADVPASDIELLGFCPLNKAVIPSEFLLEDKT